VSAADLPLPVSANEAKTLFAGLTSEPVLILAVSGGPDSMALLALVARWRAALKRGPILIAVTVDHGLRPESTKEANAVKRQARDLGVTHRTLRWTGTKPKTGLQEAAREARYRLLSGEAARSGARMVLTAHTLDDQAETVLIRLARGSGLSGLSAMARESDMFRTKVVRPLLDIPKARLVTTLRKLGVTYADDPSNRDPRFTRARLRGVMPLLAKEGLSPERLALLARRIRRAEATLDQAVTAASNLVSLSPWGEGQRIVFKAEAFGRLPDEIALRLLGRVIAHVGDEGPVELGKLEALFAALSQEAPSGPIRRTLAGALVTKSAETLVVERAPPRRRSGGRRISALTTSKTGKSEGPPGRLG
jgi:tRNA(Ile)-lysidine synthase